MTSFQPLPVAFIGHGNPHNVFGGNRYAEAWAAFGATQKPRAILVVSAHWYVGATRVTGAAHPRTVHDFSRYRPKLFAFHYPAPGEPALALRVRELLAPTPVEIDERWGFDHGAWAVLANAFPAADVPVIELAIDRTQPPAFHYALASRLAPLREEGVLILASGNVIHNQEISRNPWDGAPPGWQARFAADLDRRLAAGDHAALVAYDKLGPDAALAIPTPDHYLPLLYALGLQRTGERVETLVGGDDGDGLGMLSIVIR
jgi:4,5-DOPA dioxygenase extradiol